MSPSEAAHQRHLLLTQSDMTITTALRHCRSDVYTHAEASNGKRQRTASANMAEQRNWN